MFQSAELGHALDKETFDSRLPELRESLLQAQLTLLGSAEFAAIVVVAGVEGSGKGETVNTLTEWLDPRHVEVHAVGESTDEELERPRMWRFWRRLPPKGKIGIFFGSWYSEPITLRAFGKCGNREFGDAVSEIRRFEKMLADEGVLLVKLWFHLSRKAQQRRLDELWADKKTRYRVSKHDWKQLAHYDEFRSASELAIRETDTPEAPWLVIEGTDERYRTLNAGQALFSALSRRLQSPHVTMSERMVSMPNVERMPLVRTLDLTRKLEKPEYEKKLAEQQRRLALLTQTREFKRISPVVVFEGMDAAGKGGAVRRITRALDARLYDVHPVAAPTDEEKRQPYLWRFWRYAPRDGKFAIFDRSWYGRVLVERVEQLVEDAVWMRAYGEINDFEAQLVKAGDVVVKFWLQLSKEEQFRRFREREEIPFKRFKITDEDWRNREKWEAYERAASDMIERTSTEQAPWTLVEAEDKYFARVKVLKTLSDAIERVL